MNPEHRYFPTAKVSQPRWRGRLAGAVLVATALVGAPPARVAAQATPAASQGGPAIQFARTEHDFGKVKCGTTLNFDFVFTNGGDAPLEITSVQSSCGCTTAGSWTKSVQPGQSGTIPIQFTTDQLSGAVRKSVTVGCNAPGKSRSVLNITGMVWREIDVSPEVAFFTPKAGAETVAAKVIRIVNNSSEPLELAVPECANKAFAMELKTLRKNQEFELRVSLTPPFGPAVVQAPITIKTSSKSLPVLTVKALVMVQLPITAMPQQVVLGPTPLADSSTQVVTLRNLSGTAVSVFEPTVNVAGVTATVRELQPGRVFAISLEFPTGFAALPAGTAELSVKTSHPQCPSVRVPISHQSQSPVAGLPLPPADPAASAGSHAVPKPPLTPAPQPPQMTGGKGIETQPKFLYFTPPVGGKVPETQRVHLTNHSATPLLLNPPECSNKAFAAELKTL
ncbi:MAG: hypothetical protein RLZZ522_1247, partial [Verrucomicrobiota bacterium]